MILLVVTKILGLLNETLGQLTLNYIRNTRPTVRRKW